jgi:hypothetical protein
MNSPVFSSYSFFIQEILLGANACEKKAVLFLCLQSAVKIRFNFGFLDLCKIIVKVGVTKFIRGNGLGLFY